jgi:hypothetical protein
VALANQSNGAESYLKIDRWIAMTKKERRRLGWKRQSDQSAPQPAIVEFKPVVSVQLPSKSEKELEREQAERAAELDLERTKASANAAMARYTKHMLWANIGLTVTTIVLGALSIKAAMLSADAAVNSVRIAEEQMKTTQRAFITYVRWRLAQPLNEGTNPMVRVEILNTGATRARLMRSNMTSHLGTNLPDDPKYVEPQVDEGRVAIDRDQTMMREIRHPYKLSADDLSAIQQQKKSLWFFGYTEYLDIFGEQYLQRFCVQYDVEMDSVIQCRLGKYQASD